MPTKKHEAVLQGLIDQVPRLLGTIEKVNYDGIAGRFETVDKSEYMRWTARSENIVGKTAGSDSAHASALSRSLRQGSFPVFSAALLAARGVLQAVLDDLGDGMLHDTKKLIHAEVLDDFLEQAESLLAAGYKGPAAVAAGCVLEDTLRSLCRDVPSIELPDRPKLDWMNGQLAKADVYSKLTLKKVTAMADVRNNAAHGHWDKFTDEDVEDMVRGVRQLVVELGG